MTDSIINRKKIIQALSEELVGPSPQGRTINCLEEINFQSEKDFYGPWKQDNGEKILQRDPPTIRYGVGVLYPIGTPVEDESFKSSQEDKDSVQDNQPDSLDTANALNAIVTEDVLQSIEEIKKGVLDSGETDLGDFDLSPANAYKPSSMGISFLGEFPKGSSLIIEAVGGRYRQKTVKVCGKERNWWLRSPVSINAEFAAGDICDQCDQKERRFSKNHKLDGLELSVEVFSRPYQKKGESVRLVTVCLVNRSSGSSGEKILFQAGFQTTIVSPDSGECVLPYPGRHLEADKDDEEEQSLALLYRKMETYAVGHGCAANWDKKSSAGRVKTVSAECLPTFETPSITPDITHKDGSLLEVPIAPLAGLVEGEDGFDALSEVIELYQNWISEKRAEIPFLNKAYQDVAQRHMDECDRTVERMRKGLNYLLNDAKAKRAFQLANYAILLQQVHTRREPRKANYDSKLKRYNFSEPYQVPNPLEFITNRGKWRAFQIAFLLLSIQSTAEGNLPERSTVELIWFPTGGGKTEAYLGLSAFSIFMRRLKNQEDVGVNVLMRYTLRLLTAQQFQRASTLICAMEHLRRQYVGELGTETFSVGIWVGGDTTPNTRKQAGQAWKQLQKSLSAENPFLLSRCPWCGAQMGHYEGKLPKMAPKVLGYLQSSGTIIFKCLDNACEFYKDNGLPIYVLDEDIYDKRPSLLIGTVDKFAQLAWRPEARAIFGIAPKGERQGSPPGLIIQDELHLIAGPLGSVVGLYETVIEELCTDRRGGQEIRPKIVCATATIRRYADQVKALFGRADVALFPSPGIDAEDSFFSRYARNSDGELQPGRIYVGVHAPGLGSLQTAQVRTFASLLQAPFPFPTEEQDPWWTLLMFFNSLNELGMSLSLLQSDIPDYLKVVRNRFRFEYKDIRRLRRILELTGRIRSDKVPEAITNLEVSCTNTNKHLPVDVCLASNIIEVGVDIERLSLMAVVAQPKTTSQYIQVTGRVGRKWWEKPGLIVTIYSPTKPRDRSHFEKFRSYHERLYAQVEPTSVTPFSPPVLDRALHAVIATYVRQTGDEGVARSPYPYPENLIEQLQQILLPRIEMIDPAELDNFQRVFEKRVKEWQHWQPTNWQQTSQNSDKPLLRAAGAYATSEQSHLSWATPVSMRNVDAECEAQITQLYIQQGAEDA